MILLGDGNQVETLHSLCVCAEKTERHKADFWKYKIPPLHSKIRVYCLCNEALIRKITSLVSFVRFTKLYTRKI